MWATDSSGSYTSSGAVPGTSSALEMLEPSFHQDLNADGQIGAPTVIESFGSISLVVPLSGSADMNQTSRISTN